MFLVRTAPSQFNLNAEYCELVSVLNEQFSNKSFDGDDGDGDGIVMAGLR